MTELYTYQDVPELVRLAVEKGRVVKDAFPSVYCATGEMYTEFQIGADGPDINFREAAAYIAVNIISHFEPASKYLYWRIRPEFEPAEVDWLEGTTCKKKTIYKFYARLLITDEEETYVKKGQELVLRE
jgi:hypothetical protein